MKISIVIENGKVTVDVENEQPIVVEQKTSPIILPPKPDLRPLESKPQRLPTARAQGVTTSLNEPRDCEVCGEPFKPKRHDSRFCSIKCQRSYHNSKSRAKAKAERGTESTEREPEVKYCKTCQAWTAHDTAHHPKDEEPAEPEQPAEPEPSPATEPEPEIELRSVCCDAKVEEAEDKMRCLACGHLCETKEFLPGHEKSAEEIESWRPKPIVPGTPEYDSSPRSDSEARRAKKREHIIGPT